MNTIFVIQLVLAALAAGYAVGVVLTRRKAQAQADAIRQQLDAATRRALTAEATLQAERSHHADTLARQAEQSRQQTEALRREFRAVAADMARTEGVALRQQHLQSLEAMLRPLGRDIENFKKEFVQSHAAMDGYVKALIEQTASVGREAEELTRALKGNNKLQGNWGEAILKNLLEASGLTEGRDFTTQQAVTDSEGRKLMPDVVVHLPQGRHIIIDSKVSLTAYTAYVNAEDAAQSAAAIREHVASVRRHVAELGAKEYDKAVDGAIGYTLMFIPGEGPYIAAVAHAPEIITEAYRARVIIVNPTNLLMALQLTYNLWQTELQSRSVKDIYTSAGRLYKKFCGFAENFMKIGRDIDALSRDFAAAQGQLSTGRGNIVRQLEGWKEKGLTTSGKIPEALLADDADDE